MNDYNVTMSHGERVIETSMNAIEEAANGIPSGALGPDDKPGTFELAPEVRAVANRLITDVSRFGHLAQARILYLFRNTRWESKGRTVLGKAKVMNEEERFKTGYDLQVTINHNAWQRASALHQDALTAHELCHFSPIDDDKDGNPRWGNALHDLEEFNFIVRVYGQWDESLRVFMDAHAEGVLDREQMRLFDTEPEERDDDPDFQVEEAEGTEPDYSVDEAEDNHPATTCSDCDLPMEEHDGEVCPSVCRACGYVDGFGNEGDREWAQEDLCSQCVGECPECGTNVPAGEMCKECAPNAINPNTPAFIRLDDPYESTDLNVYAVEGDWSKDQLAEAAFQGGRPLESCVIRLTREQERSGKTIEQVFEYHWDGETELKRLTSAMRPGFVREHAAAS